MKRVTFGAALWTGLLVAGCQKEERLLEPIAHAHPTSAAPTRVVPATEWRGELGNAYRLRPDERFLLAFGEIDRLAAGQPAPPGKAAAAIFAGGKWTVRIGEADLGTLPELPDFPDYFPLLVARAKAAIPGSANSSPTSFSAAGRGAFLMPGLLDGLRSAERSWDRAPAFGEAMRCFARIAFQMPDRLELAPLIAARALALLAADRARNARAGMEEEVLLAHALGYTRHAEALAATLPAGSPVLLFEALDEAPLQRMASQPGSSEEIRYLALRRATGEGNLKRWRETRMRLFPGNDSLSLVATGLEVALPAQGEVTEKKERLAEALPRAVLRELGSLPASRPPGAASGSEFDGALAAAVSGTRGFLWDGAALTAYYRAAESAALREDDPTRIPEYPIGPRSVRLDVERMRHRYQQAPPDYPHAILDLRALAARLDARPAHRAELAAFIHYNLHDLRAAEDLHRSLVQVLGEGSRKQKAESALYLGDWATVERLERARETTAPDASAILWSWYGSRAESDRLEREYDALIERFPRDWDATNCYVELLRSRKKYGRACEVVERWLARNTDPRTPGYFHAHIRLAHNYALGGEFEKGRKVLEGMSANEEFGHGIQKRGTVECLAGLGRLKEAEALGRQVVRERYWDSEAWRDLVRVLWAEGKDGEAADALADPKSPLESWELCQALSDDLSEVFLDLPDERLASAVAAIQKRPALARSFACVPSGFAKAGRYEIALRVASQLSPSGHVPMDQLIVQYGYMKSWKGREAAAAWLKAQIPPGELNPLSMKALYTKNDDLLWDVIVTPDEKNHPEWVWLFRACAFALRGKDAEAHRPALLAYYEKPNPDPYHVMGRYLVGLATEADMFALAADPRRRSEIAYYLGARAEGEKRFREACEWYRVAAESAEPTSPRALAIYTLAEWAGTGQGLWKLETSANPATPSTAPPDGRHAGDQT